MKRLACLLVFLVANAAAWADVVPPGYKSVSCDITVETTQPFADFVFFASFKDSAERIEIEPGKPYTISEARQAKFFYLFAVPRDKVTEAGEVKVVRQLTKFYDAGLFGGFKFPYMRRSVNIQRIDIRTRAHAQYRIERINQEEGVVLKWLGGGEEEKASNLSRIISGLALTLAFSLGGLWVVRRFRNRQPDLLQGAPKPPTN